MIRWSFLLVGAFLTSCIGEDIVFDEVDPAVRITNPITSLGVNTSYQFEYLFLDNVGTEVSPMALTWSSSNTDVLSIDENGLATGISNGLATVNLHASLGDQEAATNLIFEVSEGGTQTVTNERTGAMHPNSSYGLAGGFRLFEEGDDLVLAFNADYNFNGAPGPYLYLTNNPNSLPTSEAYEIDFVTARSGAHEYRIPLSEVGLNDYSSVYFYCKPFTIRLGFGNFDD